jgi:DnaK suppressor protein
MVMRTAKAGAHIGRNSKLEKVLAKRRRELMSDVRTKIRQFRNDSTKRDVIDDIESSQADVQEEIGVALIQMKAEILNHIDIALRRFREGTYGGCLECGAKIAEARLRALPFAVRCIICEEARERAEQRERLFTQSRGSSTHLLDVAR